MYPMEKMHANLRECMNYLIQLFYKTDKRYSCTRSKISKLLSILAFKYAVYSIQLFDEKIFRYDECGTIINDIEAWADREVYFCCSYDKLEKSISQENLNENVDIPPYYQEISSLSSELKEAIEYVFFAFGAYSTTELSELLNPIVEYKGICRPDGSIELNEIIWLRHKLPGNKVLDHIFYR